MNLNQVLDKVNKIIEEINTLDVKKLDIEVRKLRSYQLNPDLDNVHNMLNNSELITWTEVKSAFKVYTKHDSYRMDSYVCRAWLIVDYGDTHITRDNCSRFELSHFNNIEFVYNPDSKSVQLFLVLN